MLEWVDYGKPENLPAEHNLWKILSATAMQNTAVKFNIVEKFNLVAVFWGQGDT